MPRKISNGDRAKAAQFIVEEQRRREGNRRDREKDWAEIDRQIRMEAKPLESKTGETAWFPEIELPLQANAQEILGDDIKRLIFPSTEDWYRAEAVFTDEWAEIFSEHPTIAGLAGGKGDQDTANLIVHGVLDHFHRQYQYKLAWEKMIGEGLAYGTFVGRMGLVKTLNITHDFRRTSGRKQPVLIPVSIKNTYLDDTENFVLQEGVKVSPSFIRRTWKTLSDLRKQTGEGWVNLSKLQDTESAAKPGHIEVLEFEGDLVTDRSRGENMFLPNMRITVAVQKQPMVIRWQKIDLPFRSYITGIYKQNGVDSPYGTSPLVKGRPMQVGASLAGNFTLAVSALQAQPPVVYDADDTQLVADGGPKLSPNSKIAAERPDVIRDLNIGDLGATFAVLQGMLSQYEDTTKVNDPRRGGQTKSHTTATAKDIELSRGLLPTEDVVGTIEEGPMTTSLYMEWELAKRALREPQTIWLNARGAKGHMTGVDTSLLPEQSDFEVVGSQGVFDKRQKEQSFAEFGTIVANLTPLLVNPAAPPELAAMLIELGRLKGITDVERYIPQPGTPEAAGALAGETEPAPDGSGI